MAKLNQSEPVGEDDDRVQIFSPSRAWTITCTVFRAKNLMNLSRSFLSCELRSVSIAYGSLRGGGSAGGGTAHPAPRPGCPPRGAPLPRRARRPPQRPAAASRSVPALGLLRLTAAARAAPPSSPSRPLFVFIRCGRREGGTDGRRKGGRRRLSVRRRTFHTRPSAARPRVRREARRGAAGSAPPRSREAAARRICRAGSAPQRRAAAAAPLGWALRRPGLPGGWEPPRAGKGWVLLGVPGASKKRGIKRVAA